MSGKIGLREELIEAKRRKPFVPFQIMTKSGERYRITDPYSVALGQDVVVVLPRNGAHVSLRFNHVNLISVGRTKRNR